MTLPPPATGTHACATEPIHIPGTIQPHGCVVLVSDGGVVLQVSANTAQHLGLRPEQLLGCSLLQTTAPGEALQALGKARAGEPRVVVGGTVFDVQAHAGPSGLLLELEPAPASSRADGAPGLHEVMASLTAALLPAALVQAACEAVRALSGFERVLVYRFDDDGHGHVIAESVVPDLQSFLHLHFPESDIPAQARALYLNHWIRTIPDARYTPVPLVPARHPQTGAPLDLSDAALRSVSPIHLEYLANMGVVASMSVSLIVDGQLWGLIACHHRQACAVPLATRQACEAVGRVVSLQLSAHDALEKSRGRAQAEASLQDLRAVMLGAGDTQGALEVLAGRPELLRLVPADGVAVICGTQVWAQGQCPVQADVLAIAQWVRTVSPDGIHCTRRIAAEVPELAHLCESASGVLGITTAAGATIVWLRAEVVSTVSWAGNPEKAATTDPAKGGARLHPRTSFAAWRDELRGTSMPWLPHEIEAASELRRLSLEADLAHQLARAERAVQARDDLLAVVSHDLRTPVSVVAMQAAIMRRLLESHPAEGAERLLGSVDTVQRSAERMATLLNDLLDSAKIEAGRFDVRPEPRRAGELLDDAAVLLSAVAGAKNIRLVVSASGGGRVRADAERLFQVLSNLLSNAIRFTPEGGRIELRARPAAANECLFTVQDSGSGMGPEQLAHVFDRYWQGRVQQRAGAGLGLYICKGIVEAHGGRIWAESAPGQGSAFHFTLPAA